MAVPWLVVLQNIPWKDVIVNAPKVADEAKKLWTTIKREPGSAQTETSAASEPAEKAVHDAEDTPQVIKLQQKTAQLERAVDDLHTQLLESSALIKALADQNEVLVKHIEINRSRLKLVSIVLAIFVVLGIFAILRLQGMV